jgi:hypothetical protein
LPAALRDHGLLGNHQRRAVLAQARGHAREHAWARCSRRLSMQPRTFRLRPLASICGSTACTTAAKARSGSASTARALARPHAGLPALGQAKVHVHRVHVFQVDDVGAVLQVVAHADVAQPGHAVEGCQHAHAGGGSARQFGLGQCHLDRGRALVQPALADEALRHQLGVAPVVGLRDRQLGLRLLQLRLLQPVVQLHQQLAPGHLLAVAKADLHHPAADLGAHHGALARTQRAHGLDVVGHGLAAHGRRLHHHGRARRRAPAAPGWAAPVLLALAATGGRCTHQATPRRPPGPGRREGLSRSSRWAHPRRRHRGAQSCKL